MVYAPRRVVALLQRDRGIFVVSDVIGLPIFANPIFVATKMNNNPPEPDSSPRTAATNLPAAFGEFEVKGILGKGGFSVVYSAWDRLLKRPVAIKEYMPSAIAEYLPSGVVMPRSPKEQETFKAGLASFINEAQLLARFTHPALVHVYRVWEQNHTAYMAMQYCDGQTLSEISQSDPTKVKDEGWLKATFAPILDVLELLHSQNCFHRDISPDNILILQGGGPILLDFGSARQIVGGMTQALTVVLKPGFAPIEQYADADNSGMQQGPWTDIYGVGAVLYYLLMGKPPVASVARLVKDPVGKLADHPELTGVSRSFRQAIDRALAVIPSQRIQSIAELREALKLPTYKPDGQFGISPSAPIEVVQGDSSAIASQGRTGSGLEKTMPSAFQPRQEYSGGAWERTSETTPAVPEEKPPSDRTDDVDSGAGLDNDPHTLPFPPSVQTSPAADSRQPLGSAAQARPQSRAAAAARQPAKRRNRVLDIGLVVLVVAVLAVMWGLLRNKPATAVGADQHIAASSTTATSASQPSLPPTQPPANPASGVTAVVTGQQVVPSASATASSVPPEAPITVASDNIPVQPLAPKIDTPPIEQSRSPGEAPFVRLFIHPWGQVDVDGKPIGLSPPLVRLPLSPGPHVLTITNGNLPPVTVPVVVPNEGNIVVFHEFQ
ncbi:MAG: serine/threonine protein kinase [Burkholderiaceae bacterium]|jgi:non-specific serine/threonine protein kinase|nr:serine/threonine protein kinase [Burkholderiaceae bacterium]